jgi:hypothetical protein
MHWFWRVTIAVVAGWLAGYGAYSVVWDIVWAVRGTSALSSPGDDLLANLIWTLTLPLVALSAVVVFAVLTRYLGSSFRNHETRCRKCGYILRGISEPRCPECGERI